jgi:hypothetical protein
MTKVVATHKVVNVEKWKALESERREHMGPFADDIAGYVDPNGGDTVAVSMTVHDPEGLQAFLQSATCAALLEQHGVIQPVTFLTSLK